MRLNGNHSKKLKQLKSRLGQPPILIAPNSEKEFVLRMDASDVSAGAVLLQERDGTLHPLVYASRKLTNAERTVQVTVAVNSQADKLYGKLPGNSVAYKKKRSSITII